MSRATEAAKAAERRARNTEAQRARRARLRAEASAAADAAIADMQRPLLAHKGGVVVADSAFELAVCESAKLLFRRLDDVLREVERAQPYIGVRLIDLPAMTLARDAINQVVDKCGNSPVPF